jgi:vacuolar-type H+-ATPase catalytic subunit A/Vma1
MTIFNNSETVKASFEALGSLSNAVSGLPDNDEYSARAVSMGAGLYSAGGRYDTLQLSSEYLNSVSETGSISAIGGNISPETMTQMKVLKFFSDANNAMVETSLEMIRNTVAGFDGLNVHNQAEER